VDKSIGAALQQGIAYGQTTLLGVSSRLSFEIALKALGFGIPVVAAISGGVSPNPRKFCLPS
ncbi:formate dehydrogenase accessory sulfurtransferase FdhD, partial [Acidithiobacillus ferrivorans]|uniref:formate dehydrogenase accessory sulfurtransferase FdhD n=1 Tax=Acidithiobacillus ferrivorans TaxID=160808 RepID=UPI0016800455